EGNYREQRPTGRADPRTSAACNHMLAFAASQQARSTSMPNGELTSAPSSRHARFRQIMNAAAGSAHADYQGYGRFWELPLAQLRQLELYGIPMMRAGGGPSTGGAAPASASCWRP